MRALSILLLALSFVLAPFAVGRDGWSLEYHRGLSDRQRGDLTVTLYGDRFFSHAFCEPAESFFPDRIPGHARVELIVSISESEGAVWDGNPQRIPMAEGAPPRLAIMLWRNWDQISGRWFSAQRIEVRPGIHRLVVPIEPWAWINVYAKAGNSNAARREQWRDTWANPARIGVGGGGFFYTKGIAMAEGIGTIKVLALRVRP